MTNSQHSERLIYRFQTSFFLNTGFFRGVQINRGGCTKTNFRRLKNRGGINCNLMYTINKGLQGWIQDLSEGGGARFLGTKFFF